MLDKGIIQQIGSPMDLYDYPVNRFVAHFLGTTNMIEGEVVDRDGTTILQAGDGLELPLANPVNGSQGAIVFRPQTVQVNPEGDVDSAMHLQGVIESLEFLGSTVRYAVKVGNNTVLADEDHQRGKRIYDVKEDVQLVIPQQQVLFVED